MVIEQTVEIPVEPLIKNDTRLQEILKAAGEKAEARKEDPSLGSLKKWQGC
ncbi:MAG: hypothetical protein LBU00_06755 [Treponema sp.]|jgi:hypothetical protein|nr:hypothetical protein [Treponema sp.]